MEVKLADAPARAVETAELPVAEASSHPAAQAPAAAAAETAVPAAPAEEEVATLARAAWPEAAAVVA